QSPEKMLAVNRPLVDPGRPLEYLTSGMEQIIADGFGFSLPAVQRGAGSVGITAALSQASVPKSDSVGFDTNAAAQLKDGLSSAVEMVTAGAVQRTPTGGGPRAAVRTKDGEERDALDDLLDQAAEKQQRGKARK